MGKLPNALLGLGTVMIACALGLTVHNLCRSCAAGETDVQVVAALRQTAAQASAAEQTIEPEQLPDFLLNPDMEMPVLQENGQNYIGVLSIPSLELELPVIAGWDYPALQIAPCRYTGSAYTDDMVIAAHNYGTHFGRLKELTTGDSVSFTDVDGNVFAYTVKNQELLGPYAVEQMTEGDWDLTLFTCTLDSRRRVTVRCGRVP